MEIKISVGIPSEKKYVIRVSIIKKSIFDQKKQVHIKINHPQQK